MLAGLPSCMRNMEVEEWAGGLETEQRWMNYNGRFKVRTQKEPLRDSDLLVLTVCRYGQNGKRGTRRRTAWFAVCLYINTNR